MCALTYVARCCASLTSATYVPSEDGTEVLSGVMQTLGLRATRNTATAALTVRRVCDPASTRGRAQRFVAV